MIKVRFAHVDHDEFTRFNPGNESCYDAELEYVPQPGWNVEFPPWYYDRPCTVVRVHAVLHEAIPADVVIEVERGI